MSANRSNHQDLTPDELDAVQDTAYFLWEQAGRPEGGRAHEFWRRAMEQHRRSKAYGLWLEDDQFQAQADGPSGRTGQVK